MRGFRGRVPAWPPLAGAIALASALVVMGVAPLLAALPAAVAGLERTSPAIALLASALTAAGIVAVVVAVARLTRPVSGEQLGLRAPDDPRTALLLTTQEQVRQTVAGVANYGGSLDVIIDDAEEE